MAYVKWYSIKGDHLDNLESYFEKEKEPNQSISTNGIDPDNFKDQFRELAEFHSSKGKVEAYHIIQSFSEGDSKSLNIDEANELGKKLVESIFPRHDFIVITHTNTEKTHNHIVLNSVNIETGKKIRGKLPELQKLRDTSDKLCKAIGLDHIIEKANTKTAKLPESVKQIYRRGGNSWIVDLVQKLDFSKKYATSFDEFIGILNAFNINVRLENKNISFFYPGKNKGKRGRKIGTSYTKSGLANTFEENSKTISKAAKDLSKLRLSYDDYQKQHRLNDKSHTKRRDNRYTHPSEKALKNSLLSKQVLDDARFSNILSYCKNNKIDLNFDKDGKASLKGRAYVELSSYEWINNKNNTRGNLIDFVAAYKQTTFIGAISEITGNKNLKTLEKNFGVSKVGYRSFYVPRADRANSSDSIKKLDKFFSAKGVKKNHWMNLFKRQNLQVSKNGNIHMFPAGQNGGSFEFISSSNNKFVKAKNGKFQTPFLLKKGSDDTMHVSTDPFSAMKNHGDLLFSSKKSKKSFLVLMEKDTKIIEFAIRANKRIKNIIVVPGNGKSLSKGELDFFNNLKVKLEPFKVKVKTLEQEKMLSKNKNLDI